MTPGQHCDEIIRLIDEALGTESLLPPPQAGASPPTTSLALSGKQSHRPLRAAARPGRA